MSKSKWQCEVCGEVFTLKKGLVVHAKEEVQIAYQEMSIAEAQLEDLGVKNYDIA